MSTTSIELEAQLIERVVEKRNALLAEAEEKASAILASAEEEVNKITMESESQIYTLIGSELRATRDRIIGSAELEGRKIVMNTRQELVSAAFEEVEKRLIAVAEGKDMNVKYSDLLESFVIEAVSAIGGENLLISANERDLTQLEEMLLRLNEKAQMFGATIELKKEPLDMEGGIVLSNIDGTKTYYNSIKGKLSMIRARVEAKVAQILGVI